MFNRYFGKVGKTTFAAAVLALGIAAVTPAHAQFASPTGDRGPMNTTFGGNYKDPQQRAADNLAKGLRFTCVQMALNPAPADTQQAAGGGSQ